MLPKLHNKLQRVPSLSMPSNVDFDLKYENDTRTSLAVVERYRQDFTRDDKDTSLALVHYRGGEEEFLIGKRYTQSSDPIDRAVGADVLSQLGWSTPTYVEESLILLIPLLDDEDEEVIYAACVAIGFRGEINAIRRLIALVDHHSVLVRYGVASSLPLLETDEAIGPLIKLTKDQDYDVRNLAMFGLGSTYEGDPPEIRQALIEGTDDTDMEIRCEALIGLANRQDDRVISLLLREWASQDDVCIMSLEAAQIISSPRLYTELLHLSQTLHCTNDKSFTEQLHSAIDACKPKLTLISTPTTVAPPSLDERESETDDL